MNDRCPFPSCTASVYHDGEHVCGRGTEPTGELRLLQMFSSSEVPCDIHPDSVAFALYMDALNNGWCLCQSCGNKHGLSLPVKLRRLRKN